MNSGKACPAAAADSVAVAVLVDDAAVLIESLPQASFASNTRVYAPPAADSPARWQVCHLGDSERPSCSCCPEQRLPALLALLALRLQLGD